MRKFGIFVILTICMLARFGFAEKLYVTDTLKITLRTGPSLENKIIAMIPSGQPLEIIKVEGEWSHVRFLKDGEQEKEGWVMNRYLVSRMPWRAQADYLSKENAELKTKLNSIETKLSGALGSEQQLTVKLKESEEALGKTETEYEALKREAAGYLKLKKEHEIVESELENTRSRIKELEEKNRQLRSSETNKWFATGALVLLCGLLIGLIAGRQERKRRSSYYQI